MIPLPPDFAWDRLSRDEKLMHWWVSAIVEAITGVAPMKDDGK